MSNISSVYNNVTRLTGLSGLDVDSIVEKLMTVERAKVDKVSQARQLLIWKQDKYRSITSALQSFNNTYFNSLQAATDMRSASVYSAFAFKYDGADTSSYFTATANSDARAGDYTIKSIQTALVAKVTGSSAAGSVTGSLPVADVSGISSSADNNRIRVTFNGTTKEIKIKENPTDIADLVRDIQTQLDAAFGKDKITVEESAGKLTFNTSNTNTLSMSNAANIGYSSIFGGDLSSGLTVSPMDYRFKITLGTTTKEFELPSGSSYANADEVVSALQGLVDDSVNGFGSGKITVKNVKNKIVLESVDTSVSVSASDVESKGMEALGFTSAVVSNKLSLSAKLYDIQNNFTNPLTLSGNGDDISFVINGQTFNFNSKTASINNIISTVNSNKDANVKMSYDSTNDKFILESKTTGVTSTITASDVSGGLLGSLSLTATDVKGRDASMIFNDGINGDQLVTRTTNVITIGGMTFNLIKDNAGSVNLSVNSDPNKAVDLIKGFVAKYNELLDTINGEISADREYDYEPLTDTQKESMTEDQIKQWEDKAKSGLLSNDSKIRAIVTNMRNALVETVQGAGLSLSDIGIKSSSWLDKGKLYIDENKLKTALSEKPDQVLSLFTQVSDVSYNEAATDSAKRSERYKESGLISRLSDIIQDNIRTTTINNQRGILLEKAGMTGDRSQYNNILYNQISDYDEKIAELNDQLSKKEDSYYSQFAQLETLISSMNNQSSWLAQQFA